MSQDQDQFQPITITRDGQPPLKFSGQEITSASNSVAHGQQQNRWTEVSIYRTRGGKIVLKVTHRTIWQGESNHTLATSVATAAEAIEWLKLDDGRIGGVAQEALHNASKSDPEFAAAYAENVE